MVQEEIGLILICWRPLLGFGIIFLPVRETFGGAYSRWLLLCVEISFVINKGDIYLGFVVVLVQPFCIPHFVDVKDLMVPSGV